MNRIRDTELPECFSLEFQQLRASMVNGTANATIFPACMFKPSQLIKFSADLLWRPTLLGQGKIPCDIRPRVYQFRLEFRDSSAHLLVDLPADTRDTQEEAIAE